MESVRIIVAVEDRQERRLVVEALERANIPVLAETWNGAAACELARSLTPEVLILDIQLRSPDGFRVADVLLSLPHLSLILLAEPTGLPVLRSLALGGAAACLLKPVDPDQLGLTVLAVVCQRAAQHPAQTGRYRPTQAGRTPAGRTGESQPHGGAPHQRGRGLPAPAQAEHEQPQDPRRSGRDGPAGPVAPLADALRNHPTAYPADNGVRIRATGPTALTAREGSGPLCLPNGRGDRRACPEQAASSPCATH